MTATGQDGDVVRRLLGKERYRRLFSEVRRRLERGDEAARTVQISGLSTDERTALADLLGSAAVPDDPVRLDLAALDRALRESRAGASLIEVVTTLGGPLGDRRQERADSETRRAEMWDRARSNLGIADRPALSVWLAEMRQEGLLTRAAGAAARKEEDLLAEAIRALSRLPADDLPLAVLAADVAGDAHALDRGRPLATLVRRGAARLAGLDVPPAGAEEERRMWTRVGVVCDPLSSSVLVLGLRPEGDDLLARHLREAAEAGEPRRVTLRELHHHRIALPRGTTIFLCENPAVTVSAADSLGSRCASLLCTEGVPSTAAMRLLSMACEKGAAPRFHTDFDWPGLRIGNLLTDRLGATPWRMANADYETGVEASRETPPLRGPAVTPRWDDELEVTMTRVGRALYEEQVLAPLLADLAE